jgi:hypothetical protein
MTTLAREPQAHIKVDNMPAVKARVKAARAANKAELERDVGPEVSASAEDGRDPTRQARSGRPNLRVRQNRRPSVLPRG